MGADEYEAEQEAIRRIFIPPEEDLIMYKTYKGIILAVGADATDPVLVRIEGHDQDIKLPKHCFICTGDELYELESCHPIKYHVWTAKDRTKGEIVEIVKTELDKMIDEAEMIDD